MLAFFYFGEFMKSYTDIRGSGCESLVTGTKSHNLLEHCCFTSS